MKSFVRSALVLTALGATISGQAQTTATKPVAKQSKHKAKKPTVEQEIQAMKADLQAQIDDLKTRLAAKDAEVVALQQATQANQTVVAATATKVQTVDAAATQAAAASTQTAAQVTTLQTAVAATQAESSSTSAQVKAVDVEVKKVEKAVDEPVAIHYKGITLTPGGYVAGESIWRERAMNADIYTNFNGTPYMNSGEAHTSEWVPSARATRLSVMATGKVPFGTLTGMVETDFLSAGTTSNNTQSNSYTLRLRQAWGQAAIGHFKVTGGQMWSLLGEDKKSADPGQEAVPMIFDQNMHVGFTYARQLGLRFEETITPKVTVALALEGSQYQFSASNAPSNFFFGSAGALGGLENNQANLTNEPAPDVIVKIAADPGFGHYEIGGIVRFFRDRYYPNAPAVTGAQNDTRVGGGFMASARFPIQKLDVGFHLVAGDGTGRYGASLLPDVTVRPNGTLAPVRNAQGLGSLEYHVTKTFDLFGYAGTEYAQRTTYVTPGTGVIVGYAPITGNNSGCATEAIPSSGTGFAPGVGTCLGATRVLIQGSGGFAYRFYSGPMGKLQAGAAYSYLERESWRGAGPTPKGTNNFVYTSFRYILP